MATKLHFTGTDKTLDVEEPYDDVRHILSGDRGLVQLTKRHDRQPVTLNPELVTWFESIGGDPEPRLHSLG